MLNPANMSKLQIGVDATCWHNSRGYGRHARALLRALVKTDTHNHYTFFCDSSNGLVGVPESVTVRNVSARRPTVLAASANGHRSTADMFRMTRAMSNESLDVLFFPTIYSYVPVFTRAKKIVMIHDVIAEKFPELTLPGGRSRLFWKAKVAFGRMQADAIATVSDYSRRGIVERFGIKPESIHVIGEASDPVFRVLQDPRFPPGLEAQGLSEFDRLIVYVGGFSPHKNLEGLVTAFAKLVDLPSFADTRLVLVGEDKKEIFHSYAGIIKRKIDDLGLTRKAIFTGYLPDEDVVALLNFATVSVLPSLIEGFGLPAVEAAACGCPVVATTESPLPKLLGEGGLYFNPASVDELEAALIRVLSSAELRHKMRAAGLRASAALSWDAAGQELVKLINQIGLS